VKRWNVGDRVCALLGGGGYADQVTVRPTTYCRYPPTLTWSMLPPYRRY
jgi:NADPH:quinone reductase-like Zn-dependent oxidoreductase